MKRKNRRRQDRRKRRKSPVFSSPSAGIKLSLCMIVRNESQYLAGCLESIQSAVDEIIVVDTGSTDNTRGIAKSYGARLFEFPWCDDFSAARNKSIEPATGDYILWLDADDRVDPQEVKKLKYLKATLPRDKSQAYFLTVKSDPRSGSGWEFLQVRIFPNISAARFELPIHEQVSYNLQKAGINLVRADIIIRHIGNPDNETIKKKSERNLRIIEKALAANPEDPLMHYQAGRTKAIWQRQKESIEHMKKVMQHPEIQKNNRRIYLEAGMLLGRYYKELGQSHSAVEVYQSLIAEFPENNLLHFYLGECLLDIGRYHEARTELEGTLAKPFKVDFFPLKIDHMQFQQYYFLGKAYQHTGEYQKSREMYLKSLDIRPNHSKSLEALGVLSLEHKQYSEASEYFERAIARGAKSDTNYANLGLAYRRQNRLSEAEKAFINALDINPERLEALTNLGYMYLNLKEYQKSLNCFTRAQRINQDITDIKLVLSEIYFRLQDLEHLVKECELLLQETGLPSNQTLNGLEDLAALYEKIGDVLLAQNRKQLAYRSFQVSFLIYPLPSVFAKMFSQALAYGRIEKCLDNIQESLSQHAQDPQVVASLQGMLNQIPSQIRM